MLSTPHAAIVVAPQPKNRKKSCVCQVASNKEVCMPHSQGPVLSVYFG